MIKKNINIYYHILALGILIYFVVFLKIDSFSMRWWDESLFAVNTYEMIHNGKYFSAYFDNLPDIYNTKPPLINWCQIIFVKLFGYTELALRLPSAIAACFSIIVLFIYIAKKINLIWAWLSALILLTSSGFINFHTARTGDSDSLLTFFLLVGNICFINYCLHSKKRDIFIFFIFISLAFATKMFAALLFMPAYFVILIQQKKLKEFTLNWVSLIGVTLFFSSSIVLFYLRELDTPGYLRETLFRDAGRFFNVIENHKEPVFFYIDNLFKSRFSLWSVLFIIGSSFILFSKNKIEKKILPSMLLLIFVYLLIISISITKLEWYDMPIYPYLSVIAAYPLFLLIKNFNDKENSFAIIPTLFFIVTMFFYPYYIMFEKSQGNTISNGEKLLEANERYIFKKNRENKNLDDLKVYYSGQKSSLLFYKYKMAEKNQKLELVNNGLFKANDKVLVSNDSLKKELANKYKFLIIDSYDNAQVLQIIDTIN